MKDKKMTKSEVFQMALKFFGISIELRYAEIIHDVALCVEKHGNQMDLYNLCELQAKHNFEVQYVKVLIKPNKRNLLVYKRNKP